MDHFLFAVFCAIAGSSFILMKKAALCFGPLTIGGLRCLFAALALLGVWHWMSPLRLPDRREARWLLVLTALGYAYPFVTMPYLVSRYGSGFIGMMVAFVPLTTVLLSMPMLRVFPTRWQLAGVLGGLASIGVIVADGVERSVSPSQLALALSVPFCFAYTNLVAKRHLGALSPYLLTLWCVTVAGLLLAPLGLLAEPVDRGPGPGARGRGRQPADARYHQYRGGAGDLLWHPAAAGPALCRDGDLPGPSRRPAVGLGRRRAGHPSPALGPPGRTGHGGGGADRPRSPE